MYITWLEFVLTLHFYLVNILCSIVWIYLYINCIYIYIDIKIDIYIYICTKKTTQLKVVIIIMMHSNAGRLLQKSLILVEAMVQKKDTNYIYRFPDLNVFFLFLLSF